MSKKLPYISQPEEVMQFCYLYLLWIDFSPINWLYDDLIWFVQLGNLEFVQILAKNGASFDARERNGKVNLVCHSEQALT